VAASEVIRRARRLDIVEVRRRLYLDERRSLTLLGLLWLTTAGFVALHLAHRFLGEPEDRLLDLGTERGYPEVFQYTLTGWCIVLLVVLAVRTRAAVFVVWGAITTYLLLDDSLQWHERFGTFYAQNAPYVGRITGHIGEALWMLGVGLIAVCILIPVHLTSSGAMRRTSTTIAGLFIALVFFGVGIDAIHAPFIDMPVVDPLLIALEDGGELAVLCLLVVFLLAEASRDGTAATVRGAGQTRSAARKSRRSS